MSTEGKEHDPDTSNSDDTHEGLPTYHSTTSTGEVKVDALEDIGGECQTDNIGHTEHIDHQLSDRFWESIKRWAEFTTFHGIRNVFDERTNIFRRGCWLVSICVFAIVTVWFCQDQLNRYLSYKTLIEEVSQFPETIPFPAVTVCSYNLIRNDSSDDVRERQLLSHLYQTQQPNKTFLTEEFGTTFLNNVSLRRIFESGAVTAEELFRECYWERTSVNCSVWRRRLIQSGYCYTFNSGDNNEASAMLKVVRMTGKRHGLRVILWASQSNYFISEDDSVGFKVMVHEPSEFPDVDHAVSLAPGYAYYIAVTKHEYIYLPHPVLAFGDQECFDKSAEPFSTTHKNNTVQYCLHECRVHYIYHICGCVGPLDDEDFPECSPVQIVDCYNDADSEFSTYAPNCYCPVPCQVTEYRTKLSFAALAGKRNLSDADNEVKRDDLVELYIYYENKVSERHEQVLAVTFDDLWASFGGFLGISVGASIVTFMEVIEVLLVNGVHYFRSMRNIARGNRPRATLTQN